mmetsp:Transcript_3362/g.4883  ORF Transcript_3362/g.4883 Transcript_3362/m.4883 type:complete len:440 (-) Transcript_3362:1490-2809(-)
MTEEHFPSIPSKIPYLGPDSTDPLSYRFYNADEEILGKKMKDWLRFSVCYWHTFRGRGLDPFGAPTMTRSWDDESNSIENALKRADAAFELFSKLGVEYYTFHDRDVAPEGSSLAESNANLDTVSDYLLKLQEKYGIKLLWATQNLFSNPRYMNGAFTNPDAHVVAYAAAQTKKVVEVNHKLKGENLVFWGGREGYQSLLNTDVKRETDNMAAVFRMVVDYQAKIGNSAQLLVEPKPREPTKHQYDFDAQTTYAFLQHHNLQDHFKLNIEPNHTTLAGHAFEHDILFASKLGILGSIDSNTGDPLLGWDTDQFPMDFREATMVMATVIEQGGLGTGGLNFDCKVRRESTNDEDLFIGHIGAMDTFAKGLRIAAKMKEDGRLKEMVDSRYSSFVESDIGKQLSAGTLCLEDCEKFALENGEPEQKSGRQELYEVVFNQYL